RDFHVTGVQTCALPILTPTFNLPEATREGYAFMGWFNDEEAGLEITNILTGTTGNVTLYARFSPYITVYYYGQTTTKAAMIQTRSEERRVGKEGRRRSW